MAKVGYYRDENGRQHVTVDGHVINQVHEVRCIGKLGERDAVDVEFVASDEFKFYTMSADVVLQPTVTAGTRLNEVTMPNKDGRGEFRYWSAEPHQTWRERYGWPFYVDTLVLTSTVQAIFQFEAWTWPWAVAGILAATGWVLYAGWRTRHAR